MPVHQSKPHDTHTQKPEDPRKTSATDEGPVYNSSAPDDRLAALPDTRPSPLTASQITHLQRTIGNQAVMRMFGQGGRQVEPVVRAFGSPLAAGGRLQRRWVKENGKSLQEWVPPIEGLTWFYDEANEKQYYKIKDKSQFGPNKLRRLEQTEGQPYTHDEWVRAGWEFKEKPSFLAGKKLKSREGGLESIAGSEPPSLNETEVDKAPKVYAGATAGVEIENPSNHQMWLGPKVGRGVIGWVEHRGGDGGQSEKLAELTTDMAVRNKQNTYTIELRTTPAVEADATAMTLRKNALQFLTRAIGAAETFAIQPQETDGLKLVIPPGNRNHEIIPTTGKHGGYQVTKGFSFSDMAAQVNDVHNKESQSVFREYASTRWLQTFGHYKKLFSLAPARRDEPESDSGDSPVWAESNQNSNNAEGSSGDSLGPVENDNNAAGGGSENSPVRAESNQNSNNAEGSSGDSLGPVENDNNAAGGGSENSPGGVDQQVTVFAMLASVIHFYLRRIDIAGRTNLEGPENIGGKGIVDGKLVHRPNLVEPAEKNAWGLLPKTPPVRWLEFLSPEEASQVRTRLEKVPNHGEVNPIAWNVILGEVLTGKDIAGHPVPTFQIGNEPGYAFEIRTPLGDDKAKWRLP